MTYEERIQNVTIIGSAGKMGSGIVLLTAIEMTDLSLMPANKDKKYTLNALDLSKDALNGLLSYIRAQVQKLSEKKMETLRGFYPQLNDAAAITEQYVNDVLKTINPTTEMSAAKNSSMIFEAASENPDLKVKLFSQMEEINPNKPWYFTNTSSIPIHTLNEKAKLDGRIVGFHFYNPPAIQKLVEIIAADKTLPELVEFATTYAKKLRKVVVYSNDIAAFIGNGHFMRDILHAASEVEKLSKEVSLSEAIFMVNKISQEYLVRPMGIFQLCDYVGIDVCQYILKVMESYIKNEKLNCELLNNMINAGVKGGQNSDGSQKDGFFKYEKGKLVEIYDLSQNQYITVASIIDKCNHKLGVMPVTKALWKEVVASPEKDTLLQNYFNEIKSMNTFGSQMAVNYGKKCVEIGLNLVKDGVSKTEQDVNTVMLTGFYHAYGPINKYF